MIREIRMKVNVNKYKDLSSFKFFATINPRKKVPVKTNITINKNTFSELIKFSLIFKANLSPLNSIPITYTHIYTKKLGQVGQFYKSLKKKKSLCGNLAIFPSTYMSAFGQTLFQRACFISELFGKGFEVNGLELSRTGAQKR